MSMIRWMWVYTYSDKSQIQSTTYINYYLLLKCPIIKWLFSQHIHICFHLAKLLITVQKLVTNKQKQNVCKRKPFNYSNVTIHHLEKY